MPILKHTAVFHLSFYSCTSSCSRFCYLAVNVTFQKLASNSLKMETPLVTGNENVLSHEISFSCFWSSKCTSKILKTSYGSFILQLSKTPTERKFPVAFFFFFALLLMFAHLMSWLIQLFYILSEQEKHQKNTICSSEIKHKEIATAQQRWLRLLMGCHCHITRQSALTWTWTIYKAVSAQVHLTSTSFIKSMR